MVSSHLAMTSTNEHYRYLLATLQVRIPGDLYFLEVRGASGVSLAVPAEQANPIAGGILRQYATSTEPAVISLVGQAIRPYMCGIAFCYPHGDELLIMGVLSKADRAYTHHDQDALQQAGRLAGRLLEAEQVQRQARLMTICKMLLQTTTPQAIVDLLQRMYFEADVNLCVLMTYGQYRFTADQPTEYAELVGIWSREFGRGYGLGTRVYVSEHQALLQRLDHDGIVTANDSLVEYICNDALLQGLLKTAHVQDWVLLALNTPQQRIGLLLVATDSPAGLRGEQAQGLQDLSKLLVNVLSTQALQHQNHLNHHGRHVLLEAVNDGVLMAVPGTNGATVISMNRRFLEMFDYPYDPHAPHQKLDDVLATIRVPPSVRDQLKKAWKSIPFREQTTLHGAFEMVTHEGQPADINWYSPPIYDPDTSNVFSRLFIFHDVTAKQTAVKVRSAFLARVSHELRTPLTAISGFAQFILEANDDDMPNIAREYAEIIHDSAGRLNHVFNVLLDITRAYAGEIKLNSYPYDLSALLQLRAETPPCDVSGKHSKITVDVETDLPQITLDPDRIHQVLQALIDNAIRYQTQDGTITIRARFIETLHDLPRHAPVDVMLPAVLVHVHDDGDGVSADEAPKVFDLFYRGHSAKSHKIDGAGLGLTLAHSLIEVHRGKMWVIPATPAEPGGHFCFTLPA
jgi:signal transduction histidine kinase